MDVVRFDERRVTTFASRGTFFALVTEDAPAESVAVDSYLLCDADLEEVLAWAADRASEVDTEVEVYLTAVEAGSDVPDVGGLHAFYLTTVRSKGRRR